MKYLLYVTKALPSLVDYKDQSKPRFKVYDKKLNCDTLNGKIVAEFEGECEEIKYLPYECTFYTNTVNTIVSSSSPKSSFEKASCLSYFELDDYLYNGKEKVGYALHISNLKPFDDPLELWAVKSSKNKQAWDNDLNEAYKEDAYVSDRLYNDIANEDECANCVELTLATEWTYGLTRVSSSMQKVWHEGEWKILIRCTPEECANLLNGHASILIRKKVLKELEK